MNLSDFDKIPCSAKEARTWMHQEGNLCRVENALSECTIRETDCGQQFQYLNGSNWVDIKNQGFLLSSNWFKLVPKKKTVCPTCGPRFVQFVGNDYPEVRECEACRSKPKPDRFAAIDALIDKLASDAGYSQEWTHRNRQFARAIVDLIEKEKA